MASREAGSRDESEENRGKKHRRLYPTTNYEGKIES